MLFGNGDAAALNFCRVPIGASDFALDAYCCAEQDDLAAGRAVDVDEQRSAPCAAVQVP